MPPYQVPKSRASYKQNVFEFQIPDSDKPKKVWRLPLVRYINAGLLMRMNEITGTLQPILKAGGKPSPEQAAELNKVQRDIVEFYCPGIYEVTTLDQVEAILVAWREASNPAPEEPDLGESSPSA